MALNERLQAIADEINTDPLARGYSGMTDEQVKDDANTLYQERKKAYVEGDGMYATTVSDDWDGLTDAQQSRWLNTCAIPRHDVTKGPTFSTVKQLFKPGGVASPTYDALLVFAFEAISRGTELDTGTWLTGDVVTARAG
ncbi:unnamed protein product [marine sediment metagenome]|uniref:Uncharacterized protein n=1 Tax=marine sediment metagenome TaxID=412755 RepID=X0V705_9ZZZZ